MKISFKLDLRLRCMQHRRCGKVLHGILIKKPRFFSLQIRLEAQPSAALVDPAPEHGEHLPQLELGRAPAQLELDGVGGGERGGEGHPGHLGAAHRGVRRREQYYVQRGTLLGWGLDTEAT